MNAPVLPTKRKPLTQRQRVKMHDEHGSICVVCLMPIPKGGRFIDEHIVPLAIGGSNDPSNRGPAHVQCAKVKTQRDQKIIAKSYRVRAKHLGIKKKKKSWGYGKNDSKKMKMDRTIVDRTTGHPVRRT
jgi:5-methylcytosine-specific restriction enzyme A